MGEDFHSRIQQAITSRGTWEARQRDFYRMRHSGIPRRRKPYPGAADLHFPLVDTAIEKLKPFYYNQVFSNPRLAQFVALREQLSATTEAASDYHNFQLRKRTNFEMKLLSAIDTMLLRGRAIVKGVWDPWEQRIEFSAIDPQFFIVPRRAGSELRKLDWFCEVRHMSVAQYRLDARYDQKPETIRRIRGGQQIQDGTNQAELEKVQREGLNFTSDNDLIILWECYERTRGGWTVRTICPTAKDLQVRKSFGVPYRFQGKAILPYATITMEIKDEGWFSPRGVAERQGAFEAYLNKVWNTKADAMDFTSKPLFTSTSPIRNMESVKFLPGEVMPEGVSAVAFPQPPYSLDQEMQSTRSIAEETIMLPDFGVGSDQGGGSRTATEVDFIRALSATGVDMKGRVFMNGVRDLYTLAWALMLQFRSEELAYFSSSERHVLPEQALHDLYDIEPDGSPDQWNKTQRIARAQARFQAFKGHPNVNQEALVEDLIAADDARKVNTLFVPTNFAAANEAEDEAIEIGALLEKGWPAQVKPQEDHKTRIAVLLEKLQAMMKLGQPVDPMVRQRIQEHLAAHIKALQAVNPQAAKAVVAGLIQLEQQAQANPLQEANPNPPPDVMPQPAAMGGVP